MELVLDNLCMRMVHMVSARHLAPSAMDMRKVDYFVKFLAAKAHEASHYEGGLDSTPSKKTLEWRFWQNEDIRRSVDEVYASLSSSGAAPPPPQPARPFPTDPATPPLRAVLLETEEALRRVMPEAVIRIHYISEAAPVRALVGDSGARVTSSGGAAYLGEDLSLTLGCNLIYVVVNGGSLVDLGEALRVLPAPLASCLLVWTGNEFETTAEVPGRVVELVAQEMRRISAQATVVALGAADVWGYNGATAARFEAFRHATFPILAGALSASLLTGRKEFRGLKKRGIHVSGEDRAAYATVLCEWMVCTDTQTCDYEHYASLGLEKGCEDAAVRMAYKGLSLRRHPDKGGDKEAFQRIQDAYQVLSSLPWRSVYEKGGKQLLDDFLSPTASGLESHGDEKDRAGKTPRTLSTLTKTLPLEEMATLAHTPLFPCVACGASNRPTWPGRIRDDFDQRWCTACWDAWRWGA